jgi:hypothetical protein
VPIVAAIEGISSAIPAGTCPTATINVFGGSYVMDSQCTLWATIAGAVQAVMLACWALGGIKIIMSA